MKKLSILIFFLFALTLPGLALTDLAQGFKCLREGDPRGALPYFDNAAVGPDADLYEYALFGRAKAKFALEDFSGAMEDFQKLAGDYKDSVLLKSDDFAARLNFLKGEIFLAQKDYRKAYKAFNEVDLYYPLSAYAKSARLQMKKLGKKYHIAAAKANPKKLFEKGEAYFEEGDYESAAAMFSRLARQFPRHRLTAKAFLMLGRAEMERGENDASIKDIEISVRLSTAADKGRGVYYLGRAYGRRGRYPQAIAQMKKAIANYPESNYADDALYYLGIYYEKEGSPDAALTTYLKLADNYLTSSNADDAILRAGHLYYAKGDFENSFKTYGMARAARIGSSTPQCIFWWGKLAERLEKPADAAGIYYYLAENFDHTYQSYRAKDKLGKLGYALPPEKIFLKNALSSQEIDEEKVGDVMDAWQKKNAGRLESKEISARLAKYNKLVEQGLNDFALLEARELLSRTEGEAKISAQKTIAKVMQRSGEYSLPIRYVEKGIANSVLSGKGWQVAQEEWQLSYPKGYWDKVYAASKRNGLDPYLALAVIREESRFNPRALSRSHAYGLMQIIPSTGKIIAKQLDITPFRRTKMYNIETNIEMGTYYLATLIKRFDGNVSLALAGYNGGPARVRKWVNNWYNGDTVNLDIDEFIQFIPLAETRNYVQKVMGSYYEYKRIYGGRN